MPKGRPKGFDESVVLERAMHTFWREGYADASMSVLLKDMGISRQSLYDTYGDKRTLFLKALDLYINREVGKFLTLLGGPPPIRPRLEELVGMFQQTARDPLKQGCLLSNTLVDLKVEDQELAAILTKALEDLSHALRQAIQTALERNEISSRHDADTLAWGTLNSLLGLATTSKAKLPESAIGQTVGFIMSSLDDRVAQAAAGPAR